MKGSGIENELEMMLTNRFITARRWYSAVARHEPAGTYWTDILRAFGELGATSIRIYGQFDMKSPIDGPATPETFERLECCHVFEIDAREKIVHSIATDLAASTVFFTDRQLSALVFISHARDFYVLAGPKNFLLAASSTDFPGLWREFDEAVFEDDLPLSDEGVRLWTGIRDYYMNL